jgi:hypothetical protein
MVNQQVSPSSLAPSQSLVVSTTMHAAVVERLRQDKKTLKKHIILAADHSVCDLNQYSDWSSYL